MADVAFLFPGQGAQTVGMGKDIAEAYPAAKRLYQKAAEAIGWDVAQVAFAGPQEELDRTAICQPAILTTSLAIVAALEEAGVADAKACTMAAGLSLGEYSALVMAGALRFADAVRLVHKRGLFMEEACQINPGAMMSVIGLEDGIVEALCAEVRETDMVVAANFNSPGQVVISGTHAGVEKAAQLAEQRGAKRVIPLAVSGAFHSPLMDPAAERLEQELARVPVERCRIPVIDNCSAGPIQEPDEIRVALARQLRSPVRWTQSMLTLIETRQPRFIEVGPGNVLTGLMKRIHRGTSVENIAAVESLRKKAGL